MVQGDEKNSKVFRGKISSETFLKMDYFGSKSPKSPNAGGSAPIPPCFRRLGASLPDLRSV